MMYMKKDDPIMIRPVSWKLLQHVRSFMVVVVVVWWWWWWWFGRDGDNIFTSWTKYQFE